MTQPPDKMCREAFEKWDVSAYGAYDHAKDQDGKYIRENRQRIWEVWQDAWQAALSTRLAPDTPEKVDELDGLLNRIPDGYAAEFYMVNREFPVWLCHLADQHASTTKIFSMAGKTPAEALFKALKEVAFSQAARAMEGK